MDEDIETVEILDELEEVEADWASTGTIVVAHNSKTLVKVMVKRFI